MRAAVLAGEGETPKISQIEQPITTDGSVVIDMRTVGLGGWDVLGAYRLPVDYPCVVRGEGVGQAADGRRVYFGERSVSPFGAWAEQTIVPAEEVWEVPDDIDDKLAITMGIAGTGALIPLEQAHVQAGDNVLVLGGSGALGQVALQLARYFGAGRVVAAGRDAHALARTVDWRMADSAVQLGTEDDVAAMCSAAGPGFDVVLDAVYGAPFVAALKATRWGARLVTIGAQAGLTATIHLPDLLFRTHTCVGTGQRTPQQRHAAWERLLDIARNAQITVDYRHYALDQVHEAWTAQLTSPHAKIIAAVGP